MSFNSVEHYNYITNIFITTDFMHDTYVGNSVDPIAVSANVFSSYFYC